MTHNFHWYLTYICEKKSHANWPWQYGITSPTLDHSGSSFKFRLHSISLIPCGSLPLEQLALHVAPYIKPFGQSKCMGSDEFRAICGSRQNFAVKKWNRTKMRNCNSKWKYRKKESKRRQDNWCKEIEQLKLTELNKWNLLLY